MTIHNEKRGLRVTALTEYVRGTSERMPRYLAEIRTKTALISSNRLRLIPGF